MEKFKVKVTNASEVLEIENILSKIGLVACDYSGFSYPKYIANNIDGKFSDYTMFDSGIDEFKLLTINELKDMVVLKRNDVGDATHTDQDGWKWYIGYDSYVWQAGNAQQLKQWDRSSLDAVDLKPIKEEVMKEYLFKYNDQYTLVELLKGDAGSNHEQYIEVPEWANYAYSNDTGVCFLKNAIGYNHPLLIWQRESLNDKIATAEVARQQSKNIDATLAERQSQYGSFTGVANTTGQLMAIIKNSPNGHTMPYAHEEALHMICSKIARIVNGDINHLDSWHDIGGYSKLIEDLIGDVNEI